MVLRHNTSVYHLGENVKMLLPFSPACSQKVIFAFAVTTKYCNVKGQNTTVVEEMESGLGNNILILQYY
jgi:hypothetical protein